MLRAVLPIFAQPQIKANDILRSKMKMTMPDRPKILPTVFSMPPPFLKNMTASHQICTELAVLSVGPWLYVRLPVNSNSQNPKITPNAAIPIWSSVLLSTSSMLPPILIESIEIMPLLSVTALSTVKDSEHSLNIFHRKVNHKRLSYWSW